VSISLNFNNIGYAFTGRLSAASAFGASVLVFWFRHPVVYLVLSANTRVRSRDHPVTCAACLGAAFLAMRSIDLTLIPGWPVT